MKKGDIVTYWGRYFVVVEVESDRMRVYDVEERMPFTVTADRVREFYFVDEKTRIEVLQKLLLSKHNDREI